MMTRIVIWLDGKERSALAELAENERREPRAQAAYLIRQSLEQLGLLQPTPPTPSKIQQKEALPMNQPKPPAALVEIARILLEFEIERREAAKREAAKAESERNQLVTNEEKMEDKNG
jgi:hypothetical protein